MNTLHELALAGIEAFGLERHVPIALRPERAAVTSDSEARRLELLHALHDALGRGCDEEREQMADRFPIERARHPPELQDRLQLGGKQQFAVELRVVERLDTEAVADQQHLTPPRVPDRDREHAAQAIHEIGAVVLVEVHDGFRVAGRAEDVPATLEVAPQRAVVVDFAVEDHPHRAVFVRHRLMPAVEINDAQTAHAQPHAAVHVEAFVVRPAVRHRAAHGAQFGLDDRGAVPADDSSNATHGQVSSTATGGTAVTPDRSRRHRPP